MQCSATIPLLNRIINRSLRIIKANTMRLLAGIIRIAICIYWLNISTNYESKVFYYFTDLNYSNSDVNFYTGLIFFIPNILTVYFFVQGMYYLFTWNIGSLPIWENRKAGSGIVINNEIPSSLNNIQSVLNYRNSKMNAMSNKKAAKEYLKTAWLDGLMNTNTNNTQEAIRFLNSKLGSMGNEQGLKYIKGETK